MRFIHETGFSTGSQSSLDWTFETTLAAMSVNGYTAGDHFIIDNVTQMDAAIIRETYQRVYGCPVTPDCFQSIELSPAMPDFENDVTAFLCRN